MNQPGFTNWDLGTTQLPGPNDTVIFGSGFGSGNPNLNGSREVGTLLLDTSTTFSFVGNPGDTLSIDHGLSRTAASSGTQTFTIPVYVIGGVDLEGTGQVVFSDGLSGVSDLVKSGAGNMTVTGAPSEARGILTVSGGGFTLDGISLEIRSTPGLQVLNAGSVFTAKNGAALTSANGTIQTGGSMVLTGQGTSWHLNSFGTDNGLFVGDVGAGTLAMSSGAQVISDERVVVGQNDGGNGTVNIQSGANISAWDVLLAAKGLSTGTINLTGQGSSLSVEQGLFLGGGLNAPANLNGTATINIASGAQVTVGNWVSFNCPDSTININGGTLTAGLAGGTKNVSAINLQSDPRGGHALVLTARGTFQYSGTITGPGSVVFTGTNTNSGQELGGTDTYTGATIVQSGLGILSGTSNNSSIYDVKPNAVLQLGRFSQAIINLGTAQIMSEPGGRVFYDNAVINGGFIRGEGAHDVGGQGTITFNGTTIGNDVSMNQSGSATFNNSTLAGALTSTAALNFSGVTVTNSGRLALNAASNVTTSATEIDGILSINNGAALTNNSGSLTLGPGSNTTVDAAGALTLANATAANIRGGVMTNNGTVTGSVNVGFNAIAKGSGTYNGTVTVQSGGRLSPGNSPGSLTSTASDWQDGGIYHWEIAQLASAGGAPGTGWDLWNAGNTTITPVGNFIIELQSVGSNPGGGLAGWDAGSSSSWLIATATNDAFTPETLSHLSIDAGGFSGTNSMGDGSFSLSDSADGTELFLNFAPAPEPATLTLFGIAGAGLLLRRRRR